MWNETVTEGTLVEANNPVNRFTELSLIVHRDTRTSYCLTTKCRLAHIN